MSNKYDAPDLSTGVNDIADDFEIPVSDTVELFEIGVSVIDIFM